MNSFGRRSFATLPAVGVVFVACATACLPALADSSYQSSTQITGGVLKDQMTSNPLTAKITGKMFAPSTTITMVHGNQKAVLRQDTMDIWDLDKQTMTHIDKVHYTYWTATFAEIRQGMANALKKLNQGIPQAQTQSNLKTQVQVTVNNTGAVQAVNGINAQEQLVTMTVTVTDPTQPADSQNGMAYVVTCDMWVAVEDPPELKEVRDFDARMAQLMTQGVDLSAQVNQASAAMSQLLANQPGVSAALAQMSQQVATLQGARVMTVTSVGSNLPGSVPTSTPDGSGSTLGSVLPGKVGSVTSLMGAFHKKQPAQQPAAAPAAPATPPPGTNALLMQTTDQMLAFSQDAIPDAAFQVPDGYKQLPSPYAKTSH